MLRKQVKPKKFPQKTLKKYENSLRILKALKTAPSTGKSHLVSLRKSLYLQVNKNAKVNESFESFKNSVIEFLSTDRLHTINGHDRACKEIENFKLGGKCLQLTALVENIENADLPANALLYDSELRRLQNNPSFGFESKNIINQTLNTSTSTISSDVSNSPIRETVDVSGPPQMTRYHDLQSTKNIRNPCFYCTSSQITLKLSKCKICGIYCHESCLRHAQVTYVCIKLKKSDVKVTDKAFSLCLQDLCIYRTPKVPGPLLALMHFIQANSVRSSFAENLYFYDKDEKKVNALLQNLFDGKQKVLASTDDRIASGAVLKFLESLNEPLITNDFVNNVTNEYQLVRYFQKMMKENLETLIYVVLHFKIILNLKRDANRKAAVNKIETSLTRRPSNRARVTDVVRLLLNLNYRFYREYVVNSDFFPQMI